MSDDTKLCTKCEQPTTALVREMCRRCYQQWYKENKDNNSLFSRHTAIGKICTKCQEDKPLVEFGKSKRTGDGYEARCKPCINDDARERYAKRHPEMRVDPVFSSSKECTGCHQVKPISAFGKHNKTKYGYHYQCRECVNKLSQQRRSKLRKDGILPKVLYNPRRKVCSGCGANKLLSAFQKDKTGKDGYSPRCRECKNERLREWRAANKSKNNTYDAAYRAHGAPRARALLRNYGMTVRDFEAMFAAQNGKCAICTSPLGGEAGRRIHMDHDGIKRRNREILCGQCNMGSGLFNHDPDLFMAAAAYFTKHRV